MRDSNIFCVSKYMYPNLYFRCIFQSEDEQRALRITKCVQEIMNAGPGCWLNIYLCTNVNSLLIVNQKAIVYLSHVHGGH